MILLCSVDKFIQTRMDCIIEGLYIGGVMSALNEKELQANGITHILSVHDKPLPDAFASRFGYKHVFALDLYDFDLLSLLSECLTFIDKAREGEGRVLVHCHAGASRSATVVIAYLMQKLSLSKQKAIEQVTSSRPIIRPNEGFQDQLQLFENMGSWVDKNHSEYRSYLLNRIAIKLQCGQFPGGVPESEIPAELFVDPDFSAKGEAAFFKCRKCRRFLFHSGVVTKHTVGEGESAFDWRSKVPTNKRQKEEPGGSETTTCTRSLFVEPLTWMRSKIHDIQGKLHCPKCEIKIGSYVWYGEKCPCGAWVAPAFHIDSGKVDKIPSLPVTPSSRVSQPRGATALVGGASVITPPGRPLSYVPLPERSASAASGRGGESPVAAVQPRIAPVGSATVIRGAGSGASGPFPSSAPLSSLRSSSGSSAGGVSAINSIPMDVDS